MTPTNSPAAVTRGEIFAPIVGFPGYFIGDLGSVLSIKRRDPHVLRGMIKSNGYVSVNLASPNGGMRTLTVHPLVAEAFIGPRPEGHLVLHGDGVPTNNDVRNLRWGTQSENVQDSIRHGTYVAPTGSQWTRWTHCSRGHVLDAQNTRISGKKQRRDCRICKRLRDRLYYARGRAVAS